MSHSQRNVGSFFFFFLLFIKLCFSYVIKVLYFFQVYVMDLFIYASSLSHSRHIENKTFVRTSRNKFQPHIILSTKYHVLFNK